MSIDKTQFIEKVAQEKVAMSPTLLDIMQRVREQGLHKVATRIAPVPELTLEKVAISLGTQMLYQNRKYARVHDGLNSLNNLQKHAGVWGAVGKGIKGVWKGIGDMGARTGGRLATTHSQDAQSILAKSKAYANRAYKGMLDPAIAKSRIRDMQPQFKQIKGVGEAKGRAAAQGATLVGGGMLAGSMLPGGSSNNNRR